MKNANVVETVESKVRTNAKDSVIIDLENTMNIGKISYRDYIQMLSVIELAEEGREILYYTQLYKRLLQQYGYTTY